MPWIVLWLQEGERLSPANHDERKRSTGEERVNDIDLKREEKGCLYDQN